MADELKTKKITDLEENTTIDDTDILMAGDKGTNALKRFTAGKLFDAIKTKIAGWAFNTLTTTDKTLPGAVNELNSKLGLLEGLQYSNQKIEGVTDVYSAENVLRFGGKQMYPKNFTNCTFLVLLNSSATNSRHSLYIVTFGDSTATPAITRMEGTDDTSFPEIKKTGSDTLYVAWSSATTANIHANMFKLY